MDDGLCPECGTQIARSLQSRMLLHADPNWVRQIAKGATLIFSALMVGWPVCVVAGFLIGQAFGNKLPIYLGVLAPSLLTLQGYAQFTSRETGCLRPERLVSARRLARTLAIIAFLVTLAMLVMVRTANAVPSEAGFAIIGINLVKAAALLRYAKSIALRIPDQALAGRIVIALWGLVLTSLAVLPAVEPFLVSLLAPVLGSLGSAFGAISFCLLVAFVSFSLSLTYELATTLRRTFLDQFES